MAQGGHTDTDMGMEKALKELEIFKNACVKVGVTEDVGGQKHGDDATLAQIAAWNELGVMGPPVSQHGDGKWFIPPRPFIRGWADAKREEIGKVLEALMKKVTSGTMDSDQALQQLGNYGERGIVSYMRSGGFIENADSTIAAKGSSTPLAGKTGALKESIRYQIINKPYEKVQE